VDFAHLYQSDLFRWVTLPVLIFAARVVDVSLQTLRIIFVSRGLRYIAPVVGFFEVLIWLLAIGQIIHNVSHAAYYVAYAGGFAAGTLVGLLLEERLAMGLLIVRVITQEPAEPLIDALRVADFGVTVVDARGAQGPVRIIFMVIHRRNLQDVVHTLVTQKPDVFYSVEEVRQSVHGIFPPSPPSLASSVLSRLIARESK
jgi:uncharacterized protein YebE (UPF0316 family)